MPIRTPVERPMCSDARVENLSSSSSVSSIRASMAAIRWAIRSIRVSRSSILFCCICALVGIGQACLLLLVGREHLTCLGFWYYCGRLTTLGAAALLRAVLAVVVHEDFYLTLALSLLVTADGSWCLCCQLPCHLFLDKLLQVLGHYDQVWLTQNTYARCDSSRPGDAQVHDFGLRLIRCGALPAPARL